MVPLSWSQSPTQGPLSWSQSPTQGPTSGTIVVAVAATV